jgi:glycosyltransferase involved in cell wall biosynthesis
MGIARRLPEPIHACLPYPSIAMNLSLLHWLSLGALLLVCCVCLEVARGWRRIPQLRDMPAWSGPNPPAVSLIVSALNEADTIEPALLSLLAIDYPALEVIVIDDRSSDATPAIIDRLAARSHGQRPTLKVVHLRELPSGWLGKNHALQRGAQAAQGDYLLFTDADAVFAPSVVSRAVAYCHERRVDHLTLLFDVVARGGLLRMMVLSFAAAFMARFRPWKARNSERHYVGLGGFNLVRRDAYFSAGGHAAMPLAVLDDMTLGRMLKEHGYCQHALSGSGMVSIEWYRDIGDMVRGLEKNIYSSFDYQVLQLLAVTVLVAATRVWPWLALLLTDGALRWINLVTVGVGLALYADMLHARGWSLRALLWAPLVPLLELAIWWRGCLLAIGRGAIIWRGTRYPLGQLRRAHRQRGMGHR